jgi:hypothetical protein
MSTGGALSEIDWAVVTNGVDFLESAVDHLASSGERALRYAALHLNAAIETLLKAQLAREHWTLVVDDVDRADRRAYDTGDFRSVNITKALQRLRAVAGSSVTDEEIARIKAVERLRNRVAHFALHAENPRRTEVVVARGLDVLLHLIDREFLPDASPEERELVDDMLERIRERLGKIETLIRERMETLRPVLSEATQPVLSCGACTLPAYVLGDGEPGRCRYCFYHPDGEEAADAYVTFVLRQSRYETVKDGGVWPIEDCLECGNEAFVRGVEEVDAANDLIVWACFACGYVCTDEDLDHCARCGILTHRETDGAAVCDSCTADYPARN